MHLARLSEDSRSVSALGLDRDAYSRAVVARDEVAALPHTLRLRELHLEPRPHEHRRNRHLVAGALKLILVPQSLDEFVGELEMMKQVEDVVGERHERPCIASGNGTPYAVLNFTP